MPPVTRRPGHLRFGSTVTTLAEFAATATGGRGLVVMSTLHGQVISSSLVSAGVLAHPVTGTLVVGVVARADSRKIANLRIARRATLVAVEGYQWVAVEGPADLAGPVDALAGFDPAGVPRLLRQVFTAAGGRHPDWDEYDRRMREQQRTVVLVTPAAVYTNPTA